MEVDTELRLVGITLPTIDSFTHIRIPYSNYRRRLRDSLQFTDGRIHIAHAISMRLVCQYESFFLTSTIRQRLYMRANHRDIVANLEKLASLETNTADESDIEDVVTAFPDSSTHHFFVQRARKGSRTD